MSHSFRWTEKPENGTRYREGRSKEELRKFTFLYNSDLSGDITLVTHGRDFEFVIPGDALIAFIANHVRNQKISQLEQAEDEDVLGIKK